MTRSTLIPRDSAPEIPSMLATLASYEGMFGPYHPQTLSLTTVLAVALCASGSRGDGRRLLERAVGDLTSHHGRHHPARIRALEAWAGVLREDGDWMAALPVQRELMECRTHLLGEHHADSVAAREHLSSTISAVMGAPLARSPIS
jgi:hypothetical protein